MAMVINTNIASLNAQRNITKSQGSLSQSMERLSSGMRINSAKDDAAGLAISSGLTSQVRGLNQAVRNANDGISLVQTAEGALSETTNILQRMRELSVQSANGTYTQGNRSTLNAEVKQLKLELNRIAETTSFNGQNILDGTLGKVNLQVGAYANETISMKIGAMNTNSLGGAGGDLIGEAVTALTVLTTLDGTNNITVNDKAVRDLSGATSVQGALDLMNADLETVGVKVSTLVDKRSEDIGTGVLIAGTDTLTVTVKNNFGSDSTYTVTGTNNMDELVAAINDKAGGSLQASNDKGKLVLTAENASQIGVAVTGTTLAVAAGMTTATTNFSLVFNNTSGNGNGVKIEGVGTAPSAALGIDLQDDAGHVQGAAIAANKINAGDLIINGVEIGAIAQAASATAQVTATIDAINKLSDQTGVTASQAVDSAGALTGGITLRPTNGPEFSVKYGDNATAANVLAVSGLQERNATSGAGSVTGINISTQAGAQKAIGVIDKALEQVNATRGDLGAVNNRLDFTINNLSNVSQNASASRSRIEDADFAAETANLSRSQVLTQASSAMLAQANAAPQQVLSLLR